MVPHLIDLTIKNRANPLAVPAALIQGAADGLMIATGHSLGVSKAAIRGRGQIGGDFAIKAMKYAEDNSIITRSLSDESPIESSFSLGGRALKVANKTISIPATKVNAMLARRLIKENNLTSFSKKSPASLGGEMNCTDVIHKIPWGARESTPVERV